MAEEAPVPAAPVAPATPTAPVGEPSPVAPVTPAADGSKPEVKTLLGDEPAKPEEKAAPETPKAPEAYEFKVPEGMVLDTVLVDKFTPIFKELDLSQENAQKLVDTYAPAIAEMRANQRTETLRVYDEMTETWKNDTVKELGADWKQKLAPAAKLIDACPHAKEFRELMEETRLGNHPVMNKVLIWLGAKLGQDTFVEPHKQSSGSGPSLYDHPTSMASMKK